MTEKIIPTAPRKIPTKSGVLVGTKLSVIFLVVLVDLIGFGIIIPILPHYSETHFGANEFEIGILIASFSFCQFISTPILGKISDKIGRKPVISISLAVSTIAYVIFAFSSNFLMALMARSVAGLGGGSISAAQAYIADVTEKQERAKGMGLIGTAFGLGFILGPFIGGALSVYGYIVPNLSAAGFSLIAFILSVLILDESLTVKKEEQQKTLSAFNIKSYIHAFSRKDIGTLILMFFIITFSIANTYGTTPIFGYKVLKLSDAQIGYVFGMIGLVTIFVQGYFIRFLVKKFSEKHLLYSGLALMMIGLILIPFSHTLIVLLICFIITILGLAVLSPVILSLISQYSSSAEQGKVLGINHSMASLGRVLGPLWGGFAYSQFGFRSPFLTASIFTAVTLIIGFITFGLKSESN